MRAREDSDDFSEMHFPVKEEPIRYHALQIVVARSLQY